MFGRDLFEHPESVPTAPANGAAARAFAVLLMNLCAPVIDLLTQPPIFGMKDKS